MEPIIQELSRFSLAEPVPDEDGQSKAQRSARGMGSLQSHEVSGDVKARNISMEKQALKVARFMNSYRLESKRSFNVEVVQAVLQEIMTRDLSNAHYEPNNMTKMCVSIAGDIRTKVKQLNYDRYRIVCLVQIVEKHHQSMLSTAKFLWDADRDRYAAFSLNNPHLAAMACVFGIYYE